MSGHDLIVIGGSAGGIEAVSEVLAGLPADLPAAVCVTVHIAPSFDSHLPAILSSAGSLTTVAAQNGARLRPGVVYVCVPDLHTMIERTSDGGVIRLTHGPKENRTRPAVDPLFRSAALAFGPRVIGVVLSGALDDGTAGLWAIRDRGGLSVIQDPTDASVQGMPSSALTQVGADHVVRARDMGPLLYRLAKEPLPVESDQPAVNGASSDRPSRPNMQQHAELEREIAISCIDEDAHSRSERYGQPSRFACPDCGGVLWEVSQGNGPIRFRCETGHAYGPAALAEGQTDATEYALWAALRALEDKAELARLRSQSADQRGLAVHAEAFRIQLAAAQENAAVIRALLRLDGRTGIRPRAEAGAEGE